MKKTLLSLALVVGSLATAHAQEANFGLKAGLSLADLVGDDVEDTDLKPGLVIGGVASFALSEAIKIQPELLFSMKGAQGSDGGTTVKLNLNYFDLPIMLNFSPAGGGKGLFLEVGPQLGLLVSRKITDGNLSEDIEGVNSFDLGYALGAGYQLGGGLNFGLRYNGGITSIAKEENFGSQTFQTNVRNSVFQIAVGYMFNQK